MDGLFDFLHEDIKITILSYLPQKSLLKFRSVSKSWRHTIDSSTFREVHNNNNSRRKQVDDIAFLGLIHSGGSFCSSWKLLMRLVDSRNSCYYDFPYHDIFIDKVDDRDRLLRLCGPVHGLICLYREYSIALCNPSLGEIKILPPSKKDKYDHNLLNASRLSYQNVGFGYDNDKKDYKVVQIWLNGSEGRTVVEVYSRRENKWRELADHPPQLRGLLIMNPTYRLWPWISARMVYWYGLKWGREEKLGSMILSFDMHSEAFKMIEIPFIEYSRKISTVVKEDSLLLFTFVIHPPLDVDIWEYKRDWVKLVCLRQFDHQITSWMNDGLVFKISSDGQLVLYEFFSEKEIKRIDLVPNFHKDRYEKSKIEYMGSFVSP